MVDRAQNSDAKYLDYILIDWGANQFTRWFSL